MNFLRNIVLLQAICLLSSEASIILQDHDGQNQQSTVTDDHRHLRGLKEEILKDFIPLNFANFGGQNKACRGHDSYDNSPSYYDLYTVSPYNIEECFALCHHSSSCHGVEYNEASGRCEIWNRKPKSTTYGYGHECYVVIPEKTHYDFANYGGHNKVCRGHDSYDNSPSYYDLYTVSPYKIEECFALCDNGSCHGVEYNEASGRCEIWNRKPNAIADVDGYECLVVIPEYPHFNFAQFGGYNKACRGYNSYDNSDSYYDVYTVSPYNMEECFALCDSSSCHGVEYREKNGRCEIWNRQPMATKDIDGYECFVPINQDKKENDNE